MAIRLLFVDEEETIRRTLPLILQQEGFEVTAAATVPEGLELIQREEFDVLLSDLNIGNPADRLMLVSAMRRIQPNAATFILTGYRTSRQLLKHYGSRLTTTSQSLRTRGTWLRISRHGC
jgi:DNA-binding NtrC family response regulator